jgi:hypothetical protein
MIKKLLAAAIVILLLGVVVDPRALLFGWLYFLIRNLPRMSVNPAAVISGAIFVALFVAAVQRGGVSYCRAASAKSGSDRRWCFRWTLMVLAVVVLMFLVGLATIGLARHLGWLLSSKQPIYEEKVSYKTDF